MRDRGCFLSFFVICLAVLAGAFFATLWGIPWMIWHADESRMTTVIAGLFLFSLCRFAWESWSVSSASSLRFGHLASILAVMLGALGTVIGLAILFKGSTAGNVNPSALGTVFFPTGCGMTAAIVFEILNFNLDIGIERAKR